VQKRGFLQLEPFPYIYDSEKNKMDGKQWKKEELDFLLSNYEKLSFKELSEKLGRGIEGIRSKLHRMGIRKGKKPDPANRTHLINISQKVAF